MSATFVLATGIRPVLSAVDQTLDTTTQKTFQVLQTAATSGTGTITWSYSLPEGVSVSTSSGAQITFSIPAGLIIRPQTFTVTATNQVGQRAVKTFRLASGPKPIVVSPGPLTFDTSTVGRTFRVVQTVSASGLIEWSYNLPMNVNVVSSSNREIVFGINAGNNTPLTPMTVSATNEAGITSTPVNFDVSAYIAPNITGTDHRFDTTTYQTFSLAQTIAPEATGQITWSYTGGGSPSLASSDDTQITFSLTIGGPYRDSVPFTVTATNVLGVSASKTVVLTSGSRPILTSAATTLIVDSSIARTYTINQTVAPSATGPLAWNGGYPPSTITYTNQSDTGVTLNVAQGAIISTPAVFPVVVSSGITHLTSAPLEFSIKAAGTPVLVQPGAQNLDTLTANAFTIGQTAPYTGAVSWSYSPEIPASVSTSDAGITFSFAAGTSFAPTTVTVTATNVIGVSVSVALTVTAAVKPVLVSPTQLALDTTTQQTFTIAQTSPGPMSWSYTFLPDGVTAATSDSGITFTFAAETYFAVKNMVVQATNLAQVSTVLGVHISAGVSSSFIMNFGATDVGSPTDGGVFQSNAPPPGASYPSASLFLASPSNPQTYDVYGQPYGNGEYVMSASSVSTNMSNAFSYTENVEWSSSTGVYTAGAYTGAQVTYVDSVARSGEWIQLQIPDSITVTSIQLIEVGGSNATSYVIAGSNDGAVWYSVYEGTGSASGADFFTTVLNVTGVTTAYTTYRYIATATNPASTLTSLGGLQVIGTTEYVSPKLVNPRKLTFIVSAEQLFTVQQTADPAATGALAWSTTPYITDNSPSPATVTTPNISIANPYTNAVTGSFTGLIELTDPKLDVDILYSDFTIEFWVYGTSSTNFGTIISRSSAVALAAPFDWQFFQDTSSTYFQMNTFRVGVQRKVLSPFVWNHVAISTDRGDVVLYVNGVSIARTTIIPGSYTAGRSIFIGGGNMGTLFTGYLADVRIVSGFSMYTTNFFSVPTAPLVSAPQGRTLMLLQIKPTLPTGFTIYDVTTAGMTFAIARDTNFTDNFTVQVQNLTGGESSVTFFIDTTPTPPTLSAATPFVVPTYVPTTFSVFQTASPSLTGTIDWSYTTLPVGITETIPKNDTQITFAVAQYAVPYQQSFTVSASAEFGITSLLVVYTGYGDTPVLVNASPYIIASSAGMTFTINQTALYTGTITWTYGALPSGVSFSSSDDTGITFAVAEGSTSATTTFNLTATCFYGASSTTITYTSAPPAGPVSSITQTSSTSNPSISLSWAAGTNATSYSITSTPATTTQTTSGTSYTFTGLDAASVYTFTITTANSIGAYASPVTSGNAYTSAAPSSLVVGSVSGTSIPLSWTAGFGATSYSVTSTPATTTQTTSGTSRTFTGLTGGTPYLFAVESIVPTGTGGSVSSVSYVTPAAAVASIASITIAGLTSVTVTWPGSASASSYSIRTTPTTTTQTTSGVSLVKTSLITGVDYTVSVTSINSFGTGGVTTSASFVIPTAVTNLSLANQQITTVELAWTPAYGATGYTITTSPATTTQTTTDPTYTFTGLSGGTLYTFTVTSTNSVGSGDSATSSPILTKPAAVTGITPSNYTLTTVDAVWVGATGAASYIITTTPATTTQTTTGTTLTKTGLTAGTSYVINIQSVNSSGNGGTASSVSFFTLPLAVTDLTLSNPQITTADLTWTAAVGATSYKMTSTPLSTTQTTSATAFTKTGLAPGTTHTFTVTSINSSGEGGVVISSSSIVTRPAAVLNLTALNAQNTSMGLSWSASPSDILVTYTVTTSPVTTTQTTTGTTLTKTGLSPGVLYTYYVLATNASGDGGTSNTTKITLPPQVTDATTTNPQQTTMGLTWTNALSATSYSIATSPAVATSPQTATTSGAYTFTGLTAGIQYTFTVTSINASGSGTVTTSPAAVFTLSPAVASVTTSNPLTTTMDITWPVSTGATSYNVTSTPVTTTQTLAPGGTFTGLTAGTVYTFTVAAVNSSGSGGTTTSASRITRSLPPASLTPAAAIAPTFIDLSWPSAVGAVSYTVVSTPTTGTFTDVSSTNLRFTGLASGTSYTFTVSSVNASGTSETSTTSASALTLPDPPASITPSNATTTTVDLNWTAAVGTDTYTITTTPVSTTRSGLTGTSYTFPDLLSGTSYTFTIRSVNTSGTSLTATTSVAYFTIPVAVATLNTSGPQQTSINLSWTDVTGESQYTITSTPSVGYTATLAANTSSATFPAGGSGYSLTAGTSYVFRITPSNSSGSGAFTDSVARFTLPASPTLSATSIGGVFTSIQREQLTVNWIAPAIGTTTGYYVSCPGLTTQTITAPTVAATFTGLTAGTSYTFTIQSINASGAGGSVVTSAVFTLPDAVTAPTTSAYTLTGMTVGWTGATGATSYTVSAAVSPFGGTVPATQTGIAGTSTNFTGLSSGYSYTFTVSSVNASGTGDLTTATTAAKTLSPEPGQPTLTGFLAAAGGTTQIQIAVSSFAQGATSNIFTSTPTVATSPQTSAVYPYIFTGLSPNTSYTFTVQSVNASGTGSTSVQSAARFTLPNPVTLSGTDVGGVFTSIAQTQMTVNWNAPVGGASTYNVTCTGTGGSTQTGVSATSASFTGLTPGNSYTFTITAVNSAGISSTVTTNAVQTLSPALAAAPTLSAATKTSIVVTFGAANGATSYLVTSSPASTTTTQALASGGTFTDLNPNTSYTFTVQSVNPSGSGGGISAPSAALVTLTYAPTLSSTIVTTGASGAVFTNMTQTTFAINWLGPSTGTASTYGISGTGVTTQIGLGISVNSSTVTAGSTNGAFTITSYNSAGVAGDSIVTTTIKTLAAAATSFAQQPGTATNQTLVLTWTNATGAESYILAGTGPGFTSATPTAAASTGYTVSSLTSPGTAYTFTLQSRTNVGISGGPSLGGTTGSITAYTAPSAPSSLATGTPTATTIPFTWSAPAGTITTYTLTGAGISGGSVTFNYATNPSSYTLSGLAGATTYGPFTIKANNTGGSSGASNEVAAITTTLGTPSALNVTGVSTTGFTLNWSAPAGGAGSYYVTGLGLGAPQTPTGTSATYSGLSPNTGYGPITVTAYSGVGGTGTAGTPASSGSGTSGTVYTTPNAPGAPTISPGTATTTGFTATWSPPSGTIASYSITGTGTPTPTSYTPATNSQAYTGLTAGNGYVFTVTATGPAGFLNTSGPATLARTSAASSAGTVYTLSPAVTGFALSSKLYNSITLQWAAANGAASYTIAGTGLPSTPYTGLTGTSYTITGLDGNTLYPTAGTFSIVPVNTSGTGAPATLAATTTRPNPPTLSVSSKTNNSITFNITAPTNGGQASYNLSGSGFTTVTGISSGATSYTLTGRAGNTSYGPFTLTAVNATNGNTNSDPMPAETTAPNAPTLYFSSKTYNTITFGISAPSGGGQAYYILSGDNYGSVYVGPGETSYTIGGLGGNSTYGPFTLTAISGNGNTSSAAIGAQTTPPVPPTLYYNSKTVNSITFTISAPYSGGQTSYNLSGSGFGTVTGISSGATSYTLSGLSGGGTYGPFTLTAVSGNGNTNSSAVGSQVLPPNGVTGLYVSSRTSTSLTFSWGGASGASYYILSGPGVYNAVYSNPYTLSGLSANSSYGGFTLTPYSDGGSGPAGSTGTEYTTPGAPTVTAYASGPTTAYVDFTAPSGGATSYTGGGGGTHSIPNTPNIYQATDQITGLVASTAYTFTMFASGPGGNGTTVSANQITTSAPSGPPSVSTGGNNLSGQITVSWSAATGAGSYTLSGSGVATQSGLTGTSFTYNGLANGTYGGFTVQSFAPNGTAGGSSSTGAVTVGTSVANVQYSRQVVTCSQQSSTQTSGSYQGVTFTWVYSTPPQYGDTSAVNSGGGTFRSFPGRYNSSGAPIAGASLGGYGGDWLQLILSKALVFNRATIAYGDYDVWAGTNLLASNDGTNWTNYGAAGSTTNGSINWAIGNTTAYTRYAMQVYATRSVNNQGTFYVQNGVSWWRQ